MAADHLASSFSNLTSFFPGIEEVGPVTLAHDVICADVNKPSELFSTVRSIKLLRLANQTELPFPAAVLASTEVLYLDHAAPPLDFSALKHLRTVVFAQIKAEDLSPSALAFPAACSVYFDLTGDATELQQAFPSAVFGAAPPFWKLTNQEMSLPDDAGRLLQPAEGQAATVEPFTNEQLRAHWKTSDFLAAHPDLPQGLKDTKIAVVGSGISLTPELRPSIAAARGFAEGSLWFFDFIGQGTAQANVLTNIAPGAQLFVAKVTNPQGRITPAAVSLALQWAIEQHVDVITLAFEMQHDLAVEQLISKAVMEGIVVVAAANSPAAFPATVESVVVAGPASSTTSFSEPAFFALESASHSVAGAFVGGLCSLLAAHAKATNGSLNAHKLNVLLSRLRLAASHDEALAQLSRIITAPIAPPS